MEQYPKKWIKQGMDVAHAENPSVKYIVDDILKESRRVATGKKSSSGELLYEERHRIIGVRCRYLSGNKWEYIKFHTRELIPWEVAQAGQEEIRAFLDNRDAQ